jgi:hypothetical protein
MSATWVLLFFVVLGALLGVAARLLRREPVDRWNVYARKALSRPEQVLYYRLVEAWPESLVLAQVEISRVVGVRRGADELRMRNRLRGMSLDFVVCRKDSSVLFAVELDDASHDSPRRRAQDARKDAALAAAGIPLRRFRAAELPSVDELRTSHAEVDGDGRIEPRLGDSGFR